MKSLSQWLLVGLTTLLIVITTHLYLKAVSPPGSDLTPIVVEFPSGTGLKKISRLLKEHGAIRNPSIFVLVARLKGAEKRIKAGEYEFNSSMPMIKVLEILEKGMIRKHPVTIPEGYNIRDIALLLEKKGLSNLGSFIKKASDTSLLKGLGIEGSSVEGFLYPETYMFSKGLSDEAMIKTMVARFRQVFSEEMERRSREIGFSVDQVVTFASIVEKETGVATERPVIAGVFHNRLKKGIMLQSDPTVIYGIKDFNGNITRKDLLTPSPYNTYCIKGLPVGPISNPGIDSIKAVLYPADVQYLYFVGRNDGTHHFSKTLSEHNAAVYKYQIALRRKAKDGDRRN